LSIRFMVPSMGINELTSHSRTPVTIKTIKIVSSGIRIYFNVIQK
jgi:hypothetical protein